MILLPTAIVLAGVVVKTALARLDLQANPTKPQTLMAATSALLDWARERGLNWDLSHTDAGEKWGCRLESYLTDPAGQPDMTKWQTELAFRLAD